MALERAARMLARQSIFQGRSGQWWELCVGLEVHAQILSKTKLFSDAPVVDPLSAQPNSAVSLFDAAHPGTLPSLSGECVDQAIRTGLALKGEVQPRSAFERKHYFYADLPLGYQITQLRHPVVRGGQLRVDVPVRDANGRKLRETVPVAVGIDRIQLEQDSGKSNHTLHPALSLIDLNRAGVGLLEIVTYPDLRSADAAGAFLRKLQSVVRHIGTCDGNMEAGSMRCDVNVSVRPAHSELIEWTTQGGPPPRRIARGLRALPALAGAVDADEASSGNEHHFETILWGEEDGGWGERVEMKNLNSVRSVVRAVEHESSRQVDLMEENAHVAPAFTIPRETRLFDSATGSSIRLRGKEDAPDYRFCPEPDLRPLDISRGHVQRLADAMPELLDDLEDRFRQAPIGLSRYDASVLVGEPGMPHFFQRALDCAASAMDTGRAAKALSNWCANELLGRLRDRGLRVETSPVGPGDVADLVTLIHKGRISSKVGKDVLDEWFGHADGRVVAAERSRWAPVCAEELVEQRGWVQEGDQDVLVALCRRAVLLCAPANVRTAAGLEEQEPEDVLVSMLTGKKKKKSKQPAEEMSVEDLRQASETQWAQDVDVLRKFIGGNDRVFKVFVGRTIQLSQGRANPAEVDKILRSELESLWQLVRGGGEE